MSAPPTARRFTVDEYHRMVAAGILGEDDRVELLDGQVVELPPIGPAHAGGVNRLTGLLYRALGDAVTIAVQNPVVLHEYAEPQPDVAVLRPRADGYGHRHPQPEDVLLLIEVADTSGHRDRREKLPMYARAGIVETWLVDLAGDQIEVYRHPAPDGYRDVRRVTRDGTLTAVRLPALTIPAAEVLG
jgi:Uma2 family endonuclease